jgi:aspartate kinase
MSKIVMKFGGTSVADTDRISHVANIIKAKIDQNHKIAVVVSAMAGVTNDLIQKSKKISDSFPIDEYDALLSSGEQVTATLLAAALQKIGIKSRSWLGWQIPIVTEGDHKNSRIISVNSKVLNDCIDQDIVPIIPGFQGLTEGNRISTIGRGGSDASAVAIAKCLDADFCEIYTDVDGVFTTNPDLESKAKKIEKISYEEMLEMASLGAKVMQSSSVQKAMINDVDIYVKSTFSNNSGTKIGSQDKVSYDKVITGVAYSSDDAKVTLQGVKDKPGVASSIFKPLYENNIVVDMIVQNVSADNSKTDVTFTIKRDDLQKTTLVLEKLKEQLNFDKLLTDGHVSKISIVGAGMITHPGVAYRMFDALSSKKINIMVISTSEIKISVLIDEKNTKEAVKTIHQIFELDK